MNIRDLLSGNSPVSRLSPISINSASSDSLPDANTIGADLIDHKYDAEWDAGKSDDPPVSFEFHNTSFDSFSHDEVDGDEVFPPPSKKRRGRPPKAPVAAPSGSVPPTAKAGPGHPKKQRQPVEVSDEEVEPPVPTFDIAMHVIMPVVPIAGGRRGKLKSSVSKGDVMTFGPIPLPYSIEWEPFLDAIAESVGCKTLERLQVPSFKWKPSTPLNAPTLGLCTPANLVAKINEIRKTKAASRKYLILQMKPPLTEVERPVGLPWQTSSASGQQNSHAGRSQALPWSADNHQGSDNEGAVEPEKGTYDQAIQAIVARLQDLYKPGTCSLHHDMICFHHKASNQHFDLAMRARSVQWATKIHTGELDNTRIPLGIAFFDSKHIIKQKSAPIPPNLPSIPVQSFPPNQFYPYPSFPGYPPPIPFSANEPVTPNVSKRRREPSPESSPIHGDNGDATEMSVQEFCTQFKLNQDTCALLINMEWSVDYPPKRVTPAGWEKAGFTEIGWARVLKAYKHYLLTKHL
ncbi:hypothetical protein C8J56DRAFT_1060984 [Mycena floridula]|nr:hypothetical protein C8J56DRAFT_1060972 [Mycena floridula]KAJ7577333.1 hypothetical protein C8J56DRAFT_1060984 [Mycena floridula]